ncbi:hypothetical protein MMC07_005255 [Pseudocyphellaria aurata]|nr:hypothetical protein [Pseudocyphellaria aurata]
MFLIESNVKAILYTGDIRSEPWWVNTLIRNPIIVPYICGLRSLDKIYLDTTFASKIKRHRAFPSKAEGLGELLTQISRYPASTVFHFHAWTLGYEEVLIALASALGSQIHVDEYKMGLYSALNAASSYDGSAHDGAALCGFRCGNWHQPGRLTSDPEVKIHSCDLSVNCAGLQCADVVWIKPIVGRSSDGASILEPGAGGGESDLVQAHEIELEDTNTAIELINLCSRNIKDRQALVRTLKFISTGLNSAKKTLTLDALKLAPGRETIPLEELAALLSNGVAHDGASRHTDSTDIKCPKTTNSQGIAGSMCQLPKEIQFPYARHSSYNELCHLISVFKPADVYPCCVDEASWTCNVSIESLFGRLCSGNKFAHDTEMLLLHTKPAEMQSCNTTSVEPPERFDSDTSSQRIEDFKDTNDKDILLTSPTQSLPASPVRNLKRHCPSTRTLVAKDGQNINTGMIELPFDFRQYEQILHSVRNAFVGWLSHPEGYTVLPKSDVYDTVQPQNPEIEFANITFQLDSSMEASTPYCVLEHSTTKRNELNCRWSDCNDSFVNSPTLREHVLDCHLAQVNTVDSSNYICLWRGCHNANSSPFSNARQVIRHLDQKHGLKTFTESNGVNSELTFDKNEATDAIHPGVRGIKERFIEAPNDPISSFQFDSEGHDSDRNNTSHTIYNPRINSTEHDSQISLCDSAFESQASLPGGSKTKPEQLRHRKDAYRAAKGRSKLSWENDPGLISTTGGHGIEETDL